MGTNMTEFMEIKLGPKYFLSNDSILVASWWNANWKTPIENLTSTKLAGPMVQVGINKLFLCSKLNILHWDQTEGVFNLIIQTI